MSINWSKRACCCRKLAAAGLVASFFWEQYRISSVVCYAPRRKTDMQSHLRTFYFFLRWASFLLAAAVLTNSAAFGQRIRNESGQVSATLHRAVTEASTKYKIPGLAVALIQQGRVVGIEVSGVRDMNSSAPVTENTVFEAGSLSEPVFAYAILDLAAEGRLDLGAPVTQYFPLPYHRIANPFLPATSPIQMDQITDVRFQQITGIRLLNHTSGMPNWVLNDHLRLLFNPGERWSYSGEGEVYLQHAAEQVTGQSFASLVSRYVFGPAAMTHSGYVWRPEYEASIATGYDRDGHPVPSNHYVRAIGPKTLYTTVGDYSRFVCMVLASSIRQRIHEGAVSLMLNPTVSVDSSNAFSWGMGWGLEQSAGNTYFFHWSAQPGFSSFVIASRKTGDGIVLFSIGENGLNAARDIIQTTLGGDHPVFKSPILHQP